MNEANLIDHAVDHAMVALRLALLEDALTATRAALAKSRQYAATIERRLLRAEFRKKQMRTAYWQKLNKMTHEAWRGRVAVNAGLAAYGRRKEDAKKIAALEAENASLRERLDKLGPPHDSVISSTSTTGEETFWRGVVGPTCACARGEGLSTPWLESMLEKHEDKDRRSDERAE